ncbi:hypothetical protein [Methylobacterium sp.]|uniref:hypothetical protein n=2 Tax=Methylobacterium sp. TaxID=409 RepID=UPI003C78F3A0
MRIVTFGSCLSRSTVAQFIRMYGGELISSVYHNRSDAFMGRFIDKDWTEYPYDEFVSIFRPASIEGVSIEKNPSIILRNQYLPWIGSHGLDEYVSFLEAVKSEPDLIVVDNHVDLGARLLARKGDDKAGIFSMLGGTPKNLNWELRERLAIKESIHSMKRFLSWIHESAPKATIVFINFPYVTYVDAPERVKRTKSFEADFSSDHAVVVPCLDVPMHERSPDPQHFRSPMYARYAGIIMQELVRQGKVKIEKEHQDANGVADLKASQRVMSLYRNGCIDELLELADNIGFKNLKPNALYFVGIALMKAQNDARAFDVFKYLLSFPNATQQTLKRAINLAAKLGLEDERLALTDRLRFSSH